MYEIALPTASATTEHLGPYNKPCLQERTNPSAFSMPRSGILDVFLDARNNRQLVAALLNSTSRLNPDCNFRPKMPPAYGIPGCLALPPFHLQPFRDWYRAVPAPINFPGLLDNPSSLVPHHGCCAQAWVESSLLYFLEYLRWIVVLDFTWPQPCVASFQGFLYYIASDLSSISISSLFFPHLPLLFSFLTSPVSAAFTAIHQQ